MKVYIQEYAVDTTLLFSNEGRVLGVYSDIDDAQSDYAEHTAADEKLVIDGMPLDPLDFNDAA